MNYLYQIDFESIKNNEKKKKRNDDDDEEFEDNIENKIFDTASDLENYKITKMEKIYNKK